MTKQRGSTEYDERRRAEERLRAIVEGTAAKTGEEFFRSLVRHLAEALGTRYVFVGEVEFSEPQRVRTLAVWSGDGFGENFEYELADTPCAGVVGQSLCFYPRGIQQIFPQDRLLADMGAESYLGTPLVDSSGHPLGLLVAMGDRPMDEDSQGRDLMRIFASRAGAELERQRVETALRESEHRSRLVIENALDAVITIDARGTVTGWNTRADAVFGWSPAEATGRDLSELIIPPELRDAHRAGMEHFLASGEGPLLASRIEIEGLHRSGRRVPVELSIAALPTRGSYEFSAFVRDISERRRIEEERRKLESQIQYAKKLESLGVLAGGIAHDFNNLLTGILANTGIAQREFPPDHKAQRRLSEVVEGSKLAAHLTGQLLDYAGTGPIRSRPLDLSDEAGAHESLLRASVRGRARLRFDLAEKLPAVEADPAQIHQILMNLVTNAAESSEDEVAVEISTRQVDLPADELSLMVPGSALGPGRHVALDVEDDGWGLDEATQKRIFDPFFTTKATGRGLGLASMLGIVHQHGGGVRVLSSPGAGTRFRIVFPASEKPAERAPDPAVRELTGKGRVLVVDDDEYVLQAVQLMLESYGHSVIVAESGESAISIYRERQGEIDLVVLDLIMPGLSGEETFDMLRGIRPDVRVLLSTGYANGEAARRLAAGGVTGVLRKPYTPDQLAAEVDRVLGSDRASPAAAELDSELAALRASYREKLPMQLRELISAVRLARAPDAAQLRHEAWALAHRLKGTGGTHGFPELAESLAVVEETLRVVIERGEASAVEWAEIDSALARATASL